MSNAKYYIDIEYYYEKYSHKSRFKEPFSNKQEAMKFANNLAQAAIDDLRQNSPSDKNFNITHDNESIDVSCFITGEDGRTIIPSIISYTIVQDN